MVRIVGKIGIHLLLFWSTCWADVTMRVLDTQGAPLVQAGTGHPFIVEVSVTDAALNMSQQPVVQGIEQFAVKNTGINIITVNGKTSAKYRYEVRIDVPGSYAIGPAKFVHKKQQLTSNTIRVLVGDEQVEQKNVTRKKRDAPVLLRLVADKERAVVGERVGCCLRFYYTDPSISLQKFIEQPSDDIRRKQSRGPLEGNEQINGITYQYAQWEWEVYPQKPGRCVIPAYGADYDREVERDDFWGGLGKFFGNHVETKRVYSNALSLQVDTIPKSEKELQGVGSFTAMRMSAKPSVAKQGEGVVVAVEVEGDGDPDAILFSGLQGVPASLKYYESNQSVIGSEEPGKDQIKRFEFIVQGLKTGSWDIPAQSFYYYDVDKRSFQTLYTAPLSITIMPGTNKTTLVNEVDQNNERNTLHEITNIHDGPWYPTRSITALPLWLFLVLVLLPGGIILYRVVVLSTQKRMKRRYRANLAYYAFRTARKRLFQLKKTKDVQQLYKLFAELFADRWQEPISA